MEFQAIVYLLDEETGDYIDVSGKFRYSYERGIDRTGYPGYPDESYIDIIKIYDEETVPSWVTDEQIISAVFEDLDSFLEIPD